MLDILHAYHYDSHSEVNLLFFSLINAFPERARANLMIKLVTALLFFTARNFLTHV